MLALTVLRSWPNESAAWSVSMGAQQDPAVIHRIRIVRTRLHGYGYQGYARPGVHHTPARYYPPPPQPHIIRYQPPTFTFWLEGSYLPTSIPYLLITLITYHYYYIRLAPSPPHSIPSFRTSSHLHAPLLSINYLLSHSLRTTGRPFSSLTLILSGNPHGRFKSRKGIKHLSWGLPARHQTLITISLCFDSCVC